MLLLSGFGLGCLLPLFLIVFRDFRHQLVGRVFLLVLIASVAFLINPLLAPEWRWLTSDVQTALPGLFWLLCQLIFAPRPQLKSIWGAMALYSFVAPAVTRFIAGGEELSQPGQFFGWELGQCFEYVVILHGLFLVVTHWRDDLVEARRKARLVFLLVVGSAVGIAAVSLNFGIYDGLLRSLITSIAASVTLVCLVRTRDGILDLAPESNGQTTESGEQPVMADPGHFDANEVGSQHDDDALALNTLMATGFYTTGKLTLKKLSAETGIPEYRLRKVISQKLGYRNFNDYINQLRIAEAARQLSEDADVPVLNVSLDVGYRSLSSFNRAFRELLHTTPTEFRQRCFTSEKPDQKL